MFIVDRKSPMPIDIMALDSELIDSSLESIDIFTTKHSNESLMQVIRNSNILTEEYLNGELCIVDNRKHKYPVVLNNTFIEFEINDFIYTNIDNKNLMNSIYNIYQTYMKNIEGFDANNFKLALLEENYNEVSMYIAVMPYIERRKFQFYCYELHKSTQKKKENKIS